jgi:hypothetical protein
MAESIERRAFLKRVRAVFDTVPSCRDSALEVVIHS